MRSDTSVTRFDPTSTRSALDAVLQAVIEFKRTDAERLRVIDRYIHADAICMLFGGPGSSTTRIEEGILSFRYDDVFVTVTHDGWIEVVDVDAFRTRPTPYGSPTDARARQSTETALETASTALAEAEEHVRTAATGRSDGELVDPLWAVLERLRAVRTSIDDVTPRPPSIGSPETRTDDRR